MRLDHLVYIAEVAKLKSISLAAEKFHISQPTISLAIKSVEEEWGCKIFHRSRLGTIPTEEGKIIIEKVKVIISKMEEIKDLNLHDASSMTGTLSVSAVPGVSQSLLPMTIAEYTEMYPKVKLKISENGSSQITKEVLNENVDIGIVASNDEKPIEKNNKLEFKPLIASEVMACVGRKSPLAEKNSISFKEIIQHPLFLYDKGYTVHKHIIDILSEYGELNILFASSNSLAGKQILSEGIGIGFFTKMTLKDDPYFTTGMLVPLELEDQKISHHYGYLKRKDSYLPNTHEEFLRIMSSYIQP